uniref:Uncharacterized protein n=1 Tax=Panagrellus redivivus TaxID=6233 RepID=A0A7E4VUT6_PANRE
MRRFFTYESNQIPLAELPYGFKRRLTSLAPVDDLNNIRQTCVECHEFCNPRPEVRDQLYITDDETVHEWASKKTLWSCIAVQLHLLRGSISLDQLRRLMKGTLRKVEITAEIELEFNEYADAVQVIVQHVRGYRYNFNLDSTPELITEVKDAVENNRYLHVKDNGRYHCTVIHKTMYIVESCISICSYLEIMISASRLMADGFIALMGGKKQSSPAKTEVQLPMSDSTEFVIGILNVMGFCFLFATIFLFIIAFALRPTLKSKPDP